MKKEAYIDIIENAISCYSEERIRAFSAKVHEHGLTEHGFPRLTVAMGILLAFGRGERYRELFLDNMDFCCERIPVSPKAANNFSVREVCLCIELLREKKTVDNARIEKWIADLRGLVPQTAYQFTAKTPEDRPGNWSVFAAISEIFRDRLCGVDTSDFIELQLNAARERLDENGMYRDPGTPLVYDAVPRMLFDMAYFGGYEGESVKAVRDRLCRAAEYSVRMQSVTGCFPFGGRSSQCLYNELLTAANCEYHAALLASADPEKAGQYKAAAELACRNALDSLALYQRQIKNRFPIDSFFGCEKYAYFDKYMITTASFAYLAYLLAVDGIPTAKLPDKDAFSLSADFHKIFARGFGWFLEFDTDASTHYDASGLGRIHRRGCSETVLLSVPFPAEDSSYRVEHPNRRSMSLCAFSVENGEVVCGSCVPCSEVSTEIGDGAVTVRFEQALGSSPVKQTYRITENALLLRQTGGTGWCLPVLAFDGETNSTVTVEENRITVEYGGTVGRYSFAGSVASDETYENRNGVYRVFSVNAAEITVECYQK